MQISFEYNCALFIYFYYNLPHFMRFFLMFCTYFRKIHYTCKIVQKIA